MLSVRIGQDLLKRVNSVVEVLRTSQVDFVKEALDEKTKYYEDRYKNELTEIDKIKEKILRRETASGASMHKNENGQGTVRRGSTPNVGEISTKDRKDKGQTQKG